MFTIKVMDNGITRDAARRIAVNKSETIALDLWLVTILQNSYDMPQAMTANNIIMPITSK
jgi:hypothetical protein